MDHIIINQTTDRVTLIGLMLAPLGTRKQSILAGETLNLTDLGNPSGLIFYNIQLFEAVFAGTLHFVVAGVPLTQAESIAYINLYSFSSTPSVSIPLVVDEADRDTNYPSPTDLQQLYNQRTNSIETYYADFELWVSNDMIVMIRQSVSILVNRLIYIDGFFTVSLFDYSTVSYPKNSATEKGTIGVVTQIGKDLGGNRAFIAVAHSNQYFVDFGESIAVGEWVEAKINGSESDIGKARGLGSPQTGVVGKAVQNSGATIGKAAQVLVLFNLAAEVR